MWPAKPKELSSPDLEGVKMEKITAIIFLGVDVSTTSHI